METIRLKTEFYILKCYQTFHLILLILVVMCHFIAHFKFLLLYTSLKICFGLGIVLYVIIFTYILISNIIIFTKRYTPTILYNINHNIKFIAVICVIKGLILSGVYWLNYSKYQSFIENCPFSFTPDQMTNLISKTNTDNLKKTCQIKRCFFIKEYSIDNDNNDIITKNEYLCNFNLYNSYLKNFIGNDEECNYISLYGNYNNQDVKYKDQIYFKKCKEFSYYYRCPSKEKRHDKFNISKNLKCPTKFKPYRVVVLGILFPLIDIAADLTIIIFIHCQYNIIIKIINFEAILGQILRYSASSLNSTKDSSVIIKNGINGNNRNVLQQLNLNQTEVYISQNLMNDNNININNNGEMKGKSEEEIICRNRIELTESNNELINSKNELIDFKEDNIHKLQNNG